MLMARLSIWSRVARLFTRDQERRIREQGEPAGNARYPIHPSQPGKPASSISSSRFRKTDSRRDTSCLPSPRIPPEARPAHGLAGNLHQESSHTPRSHRRQAPSPAASAAPHAPPAASDPRAPPGVPDSSPHSNPSSYRSATTARTSSLGLSDTRFDLPHPGNDVTHVIETAGDIGQRRRHRDPFRQLGQLAPFRVAEPLPQRLGRGRPLDKTSNGENPSSRSGSQGRRHAPRSTASPRTAAILRPSRSRANSNAAVDSCPSIDSTGSTT